MHIILYSPHSDNIISFPRLEFGDDYLERIWPIVSDRLLGLALNGATYHMKTEWAGIALSTNFVGGTGDSNI
ncbi:MAG: hypothetical protein F4Y82_04390 [Cenarchaeum sp. SB0665_bin_23]|nr:hypothetical protein [Cenarchaeum sp. SB0667_bin_13]MXY37469.1 hypothetical protein [Cenarchaeum sp. SB0664_bin_35]MXY61335.1 hypothetical protein [Cenarchaeum sp. SB0665_bin_23]MXZ92896.1 hypothetical protein [Cenarchaeum sp. SB0666_bin_15]MYB47591.1 hypothetical protein [Cenarchaeum sp. SB0662_bin_33]MYC79407.1 hypothetical protein [Cenarchaeum sp. SB0661_bin_35]MYD58635.1 hypothetical protein [Cenarchaeum sp. SB0678_bin_8]MYG32651.1 hypothetical protein [Cenarchaeum sp. SB0677_bin_16]